MIHDPASQDSCPADARRSGAAGGGVCGTVLGWEKFGEQGLICFDYIIIANANTEPVFTGPKF